MLQENNKRVALVTWSTSGIGLAMPSAMGRGAQPEEIAQLASMLVASTYINVRMKATIK